MNPGAVAVVLPCYGQSHYLPEALTSLREQSSPPDEVVVIDDGSPDDVSAAVASFPEVKLVRQENRGLSGARNRGLAETTAPLLVFLDADDRLQPHALDTLTSWMGEHTSAAFCWGFNRPFLDDGSTLPWGPTSFSGDPEYARLLEENVVGSPLGVMFRRAAVEEVGGFAEDLSACEDWELYLRVARTHAFGCVGTVLADYRHHGANMSGDPHLMYDAALEVLNRQEPRVQGEPSLAASLARGRRNAAVRYAFPAGIDEFEEARAGGQSMAALAVGARLVARFPGPAIRTVVRRLRSP